MTESFRGGFIEKEKGGADEIIGTDFNGNNIVPGGGVTVIKIDGERKGKEGFDFCSKGEMGIALYRLPGKKRGNSVMVEFGKNQIPCAEYHLRVFRWTK